MAESTLAFGYDTLCEEVGFFLGEGRDSTAWSADQTARIDNYVQTGYRQFLYPVPLPGEDNVHTWSFLTPAETLATVAGTADYTAPQDFGGLLGNITILSAGNQYLPLSKTGEGKIRALRSGTVLSGRPRLYAIRPKLSDGTTEQLWEIMFWPEPDAVYTMQYPYVRLPIKLDSTYSHPLGGVPHQEAILESCLSIAEQRDEDSDSQVHQVAYINRLRASVMHDRNMNTPDTLGYNADQGRAAVEWVRSRYAEYEGVIYGDYAP